MTKGKIDVIILAGGLGTRLREVINDLPKPLAPVKNRPFLDIILNFLNKYDCIKNVIITVGYMADKIIDEYKYRSEFNFCILFSEEKRMLGTGGAIKKALHYTETHNILVLNGDSFVDVDLKNLINKHETSKAAMTIVLKHLEDTSRYGKVKLDKNNRIVAFEEKDFDKTSGYINAGIYVMKRELFKNIRENENISLEKELIPVFLKKTVYGYITQGKFIDIGVSETYKIVAEYLKEVNLLSSS